MIAKYNNPKARVGSLIVDNADFRPKSIKQDKNILECKKPQSTIKYISY